MRSFVSSWGSLTISFALLGACGGDDEGDVGLFTQTGSGGLETSDGSGSGADSGANDSTTADDSGTGDDSDSVSTGSTDDTSGTSSGPSLDVGTTGGTAETGGGDTCQRIDLLFIVDISASMSEEKANLSQNFPNFVTVMDDYVADADNGATGYRLAATNSSIVNNMAGQSTFGLDGELYDGEGNFSGSCNNGGMRWIEGPGADIATKFSCYAQQPKSPCTSCSDIGKERPLDTIKMFVEKHSPGGINDGFYDQDGSLLVIVILTDEDDDSSESLTTPAEAKALLDQFAGGEERYVVVTIAGPLAGGCNSAFGEADAAPLLHEFTGMVPNGVMGDICLGDLSQPLEDALSVIQTSCDTFPPVD